MANFDVDVNGVDSIQSSLTTLQLELSEVSTWVVGTSVEYADDQEFGTEDMPAQPYLRPAVNRVARNAQAIASDAGSPAEAVATIALEIEREAKKLAPVDTGNLRASIRAIRVS